MKILATSSVKKGFTYDQVVREGMFAIYSQKLGDILLAYEVIKIKVAPPHERGGIPFPEMELYPSDEQFGLNGWSFANFGDLQSCYNKAMKKFQQLKAQQNETN